MTVLSKLVEQMIVQLPGITAEALAKAVVGAKCDLERLGQTCRSLLELDKIERRDDGSEKSPYTYFAGKAHPEGAQKQFGTNFSVKS